MITDFMAKKSLKALKKMEEKKHIKMILALNRKHKSALWHKSPFYPNRKKAFETWFKRWQNSFKHGN